MVRDTSVRLVKVGLEVVTKRERKCDCKKRDGDNLHPSKLKK
jgi:hypothetical protein